MFLKLFVPFSFLSFIIADLDLDLLELVLWNELELQLKFTIKRLDPSINQCVSVFLSWDLLETHKN